MSRAPYLSVEAPARRARLRLSVVVYEGPEEDSIVVTEIGGPWRVHSDAEAAGRDIAERIAARAHPVATQGDAQQ